MIAHSMGNIVVGEALRLWQEEFPTTPAVDTYAAMQAAVPSGAYGQGREHFTWRPPGADHFLYWPGGTITETPRRNFFGLSGPAATSWVNFFNPDDAALAAYLWSNWGKPQNYLSSEEWKYHYRVNYDVFPDFEAKYFRNRWPYTPVSGVIDRLVDTQLELSVAPMQLGANAYEILAFAGRTRTPPLGMTLSRARFGSSNFDIHTLGLTSNVPGYEGRPNHSFQFHYDAATTSSFWQQMEASVGGF